MNDFNITYFEACEFLNRSKKSISRYIRRGLLHPEQIKSQQGTLEYRFSKADLEAFKAQQALNTDETRQGGTEQTGHIEETRHARQDTIKAENILNKEVLDETGQDKPEQTRPDTQRETGQDNEIISLLKETTGLLKDQLKVKDEQIKGLGGKIDQLIERDRETNIILKGLQDKVLMLEQPKPETENTTDEQRDNSKEPTEERQDNTPDQTRQDETAKTGFWKQVFNRK